MADPTLFLDFDDVLCLNAPYGGYDVAKRPWPDDLAARLWHAPALDVLRPIVAELHSRVVVTSSWLRLMLLPDIAALLRQTGVPWLADSLHEQGEALQLRHQSRLDVIDAWLGAHHHGEPYAVLDDALSGTGLAGSAHDRAGRVVLCALEVGLVPAQDAQLRRALSTPPRR